MNEIKTKKQAFGVLIYLDIVHPIFDQFSISQPVKSSSSSSNNNIVYCPAIACRRCNHSKTEEKKNSKINSDWKRFGDDEWADATKWIMLVHDVSVVCARCSFARILREKKKAQQQQQQYGACVPSWQPANGISIAFWSVSILLAHTRTIITATKDLDRRQKLYLIKFYFNRSHSFLPSLSQYKNIFFCPFLILILLFTIWLPLFRFHSFVIFA